METNETNTGKTTMSEAEILIKMIQAHKSTGPKTPEGKARAAMNARRHGLTGQFYVMNDDDRAAYEQFEKNMFESLAPVGHYEKQLAILICQDHWRINRSKGIEHNAYGVGYEDLSPDVNADAPEVQLAITTARTFLSRDRAIANIALYETRLQRMINKNKKELDETQAIRKADEAKAREVAELLLRLQLKKKLPIQPDATIQVGHFVFSSSNLLAEMNRKQALEEARFYQKHGWNTDKVWDGGPQSLPRAA